MIPIGSAESHGINYTVKYNLPHNDHGNKFRIINTKKETEEKEIKISTLILDVSLMAFIVQHTIKIKCYSGSKYDSQYQQRNLSKLQKKRICLIRFTILMGNQDLSVICKIFKILNILISTLYLMFFPLILEKYLIMKVMNMLNK